MSLPPPSPTRQRPASAQSWDQNALWLMSFGDLMLLLLCFFVLLSVVEQGSSRLNAATALDASSFRVVDPTEPDARAATHPTWAVARPPVFDQEMQLTTDDEMYPTAEYEIHPVVHYEAHPATDDERPSATHNDAHTESRRGADFAPYDEIEHSVGEQTVYQTAAGQPNRTVPDGTPPPEVMLAASDQIQTERKVEKTIREIFRPAGDRVEIQARPGAVTVRLRDTITFRSGSADLLPQVRPLLDRVAQLLVTQSEIRVETAGHTDEVPIATSTYPSNWELSAARAAAVARYLLARASIDPQRIEIAGYGKHRPIDTRPTVEGRARNRRVEIRFVHPLSTEQDDII